ncbi:hypothetical protein EON73_04395 [bacterium]|nr:MAG: hypothetical protein EON73_04395 [bacterium]
MATIIIHPESEEQENLFEQLAKALKVPFEKSEEEQVKQKLSEKYAGKLSSAVADELQEYVRKSREEWSDRNI